MVDVTEESAELLALAGAATGHPLEALVDWAFVPVKYGNRVEFVGQNGSLRPRVQKELVRRRSPLGGEWLIAWDEATKRFFYRAVADPTPKLAATTDTLEPALTSEEWAERRVVFLSAPELVMHDDGDGLEFVTYADAASALRRGEALQKYKLSNWSICDRHALAALALDGQPFGFSRDHTHAINRLLGAASDPSDWFGATTPEERARVERLAGEVVVLITALLPADKQT
jgi:hypothetical protein